MIIKLVTSGVIYLFFKQNKLVISCQEPNSSTD